MKVKLKLICKNFLDNNFMLQKHVDKEQSSLIEEGIKSLQEILYVAGDWHLWMGK